MRISKAAKAKINNVKENHEEHLLRKPNVVGVAIAEKITDGEPTGRPALTVYVEKKVAPTQLRDSDMVKPEIDGVETDVWKLVKSSPSPIPVAYGRRCTASPSVAQAAIGAQDLPAVELTTTEQVLQAVHEAEYAASASQAAAARAAAAAQAIISTMNGAATPQPIVSFETSTEEQIQAMAAMGGATTPPAKSRKKLKTNSH